MTTPVEGFALDRAALARAFDRAGAHYDAAAALQRQVRAELLERLRYFALEPHCILDLGAGTCQAAPALRRRFPAARVLAVDLAPGMLKAAPRSLWPRRRFERICADAYALPLADHSVELIFSNLMLQWCDQLPRVFRELARVLTSGGLLLFSSFGPDTLQELRAAWAAADAGVHVSEFADLPLLGAALMQAGLTEPVLDIERHRLHYPSALVLMRELQRIGARNAASSRARGLTSRARLQRMLDAYEGLRGPAGLPATYEVVYGAAFGAAAGRRAAGEHVVPLSALRTR
jgi:malonyl-CoA O-methyltransferase